MFQNDLQNGQAVEHIILEFCHLFNVPAELNPAEDYEGKKACDLFIAGVPVEVKADFYAWHTRNLCIEKEALKHSLSAYFIYAIPRPSSLLFHVFSIEELRHIYDSGIFQEKIVGDQRTNHAILPPLDITQSVGHNLYSFLKQFRT